jgi:alpha-tubulin suppressor-like RCC1 family protein
MKNFVIAFALLASLLSCKQRASSDLASTFDDSRFQYWTNEDRSILYRGICKAGFEQDIGLCFNRLSWIDVSDISEMMNAIEIEKLKIKETREEVLLIREYDADNKEELERALAYEDWANMKVKEVEKFESEYGSLNHIESHRPKLVALDPLIGERFVSLAFFPQSLSIGKQGHTCVLLVQGDVKCWGTNGVGGWLGSESYDAIGAKEGEMSNLKPVYLGSKALQVSAGSQQSCALLVGGDVKCWGTTIEPWNRDVGGTRGDMEDLQPLDFGKKVLQVVSGRRANCAILTGNEVRCWGELVDDQRWSHRNDINVVDLSVKSLQLSLGTRHACTLLEGGDITCWYYGRDGRTQNLGIGYNKIRQPRELLKLREKALQVSLGDDHSCVVLEGGDVKCWGVGANGKLGSDSVEIIENKYRVIDLSKVKPIHLSAKALHVSAGYHHTCALLDDGAVKCWGRGQFGVLGNDSEENIGDKPGDMAKLKSINLGQRAVYVDTGPGHSCAILVGGEVKCWGRGSSGQLGSGDTANIGDKPGDMAKLKPIPLGQRVLEVHF